MPSISPMQIRGARAMLGWSMFDLARDAAMSVSTVRRIESDEAKLMSEEVWLAVRATFETAGVRFLDDDGTGSGVRLKGV